ncbi:MAG: septum formation protein Maf [Butyrivibrio sp.]|uniref:Maf family protein n=1 Tax=Butyrivibrio sp. TaxID=28121 RepID=UPI001B7B040E|nr:Maf family protein [Butyrivibrio sp.]MBP3274188.1 septum formation protein Maf [Butyrivibrio sp.]MBP3278193.1 septum formation protein Maf [Butyrivibrio sp.]MBP3782228.1 septum formation protein Maf [Butyrivibrio sp.]
MKYVLASGSPRRKELLGKIIPEFEIIPAASEEKTGKVLPYEVVEELSFQKASEIFHKILTDREDQLVVIGSDTVVSYNHKILGKPVAEADAARMVSLLSGNDHDVYSGVTVFYSEDGKERSFTFSEQTKVHVAELSEDEINDYVATGEPLDKAGAYGIQGLFARYITGIEGDYYNVMGLPVARLYQELKNHSLL